MKKSNIRSLIAILTLLVMPIAFAGPTVALFAEDEEEIADVEGAEANFDAGNGMATITLWRPSKLGSSTAFMVFAGDKLVAVTKGSSVHQFQVPAGKVTLLFRSQNWEILDGEVEAGKTYHVLTSISQGFTRGVVRCEVVAPDDERLADGAKLKKVAQTPEQLKRYAKKYEPQAATTLKKFKAGNAKAKTFTADQGV